jgi:predicted Na+-dependent transporter
VALAALIAFILYQTRELFFSNWWEITKAAAVFILASMILGWALGRLFQMRTTDNFTLSVEYGTRNVGITTAMAIVVLHRTDFATFAAFYFLLEAVIILPIIAIYRKIDRW